MTGRWVQSSLDRQPADESTAAVFGVDVGTHLTCYEESAGFRESGGLVRPTDYEVCWLHPGRFGEHDMVLLAGSTQDEFLGVVIEMLALPRVFVDAVVMPHPIASSGSMGTPMARAETFLGDRANCMRVMMFVRDDTEALLAKIDRLTVFEFIAPRMTITGSAKQNPTTDPM